MLSQNFINHILSDLMIIKYPLSKKVGLICTGVSSFGKMTPIVYKNTESQNKK